MKLKLKDDPKEWRKAALLSALGLSLLASVLRWRRVLPPGAWVIVLALLGGVALGAVVKPGWFRGYYRVSARAGFRLSQVIGYGALALLFILVVTPLGLVLRLLGKDPLRLKRSGRETTYWSQSRESTPLERLF